MDNNSVMELFEAARKQKTTDKIELPADANELAYVKAMYEHLRSLTENFKKAARIVKVVKGVNSLETWRRLSRRLAPQTPEVHVKMLEHSHLGP